MQPGLVLNRDYRLPALGHATYNGCMAENNQYFAWIALHGSYRPQKWWGMLTDGHGKPYAVSKDGYLRALHKLHPDEYDLSLDELKEKYPYTGIS